MESTWQSAHSKHSVCDLKIGVFLPSPAVSLPFQLYPDVLNHCCLVLQGCQKHLGQREALSSPSPTPGYCQDPKAKKHRFSSGTAMGCDRTVPRIGLNEGPCSIVDPREMCVYVSVWWCVGRWASHDWEASVSSGTGPKNLCSLRPLGVSPAGAADEGWRWNF